MPQVSTINNTNISIIRHTERVFKSPATLQGPRCMCKRCYNKFCCHQHNSLYAGIKGVQCLKGIQGFPGTHAQDAHLISKELNGTTGTTESRGYERQADLNSIITWRMTSPFLVLTTLTCHTKQCMLHCTVLISKEVLMCMNAYHAHLIPVNDTHVHFYMYTMHFPVILFHSQGTSELS